jgi:hypothetical protein
MWTGSWARLGRHIAQPHPPHIRRGLSRAAGVSKCRQLSGVVVGAEDGSSVAAWRSAEMAPWVSLASLSRIRVSDSSDRGRADHLLQRGIGQERRYQDCRVDRRVGARLFEVCRLDLVGPRRSGRAGDWLRFPRWLELGIVGSRLSAGMSSNIRTHM